MELNKKSFQDDVEEESSKTIWHNPTQYTFRFEVQTNEMSTNKKGATGCGKLQKVVIKPGEDKELDSYLDKAIRTEDPDSGLVVGGLCPALVKKNGGNPEKSSSLDFERDILKEKIQAKLQKIADAEKITNLMKEEASLNDQVDAAIAAMKSEIKTKAKK